MSAWSALLLAGLCEIAWALGLKYSDGFTKVWPSVGTVAALALSFVFLSIALRGVPFGTAYAIWTGIGAAGSIILGIAIFGEPTDAFRMVCLTLIVAGMVGLRAVA